MVWIWCGYYCLCAEVRPASTPDEAGTVLVHPRLPALARVVERLSARLHRPSGRPAWTEDQLPWGEPPTFPLR